MATLRSMKQGRRRLFSLAFLLPIILLELSVQGDNSGLSNRVNPKVIGKGNSEVVAVVNGEVITRQQLADELIHLFGEQVLDDIIKRTLIEQEAKKKGITITDVEFQAALKKEMEREINRIVKQAGLKDVNELEMYLRTRGKNLDELRKDIAEAIKSKLRTQLLAEKLVRLTIKIPEDELKESFDERYGEKIEARQIVVSDRAKAEEIRAKLKAGADFAALAKAESTDTASRRHGGEMKPISTKEILGRSVASVPEGGLSDIISTEDGYHILQVLRRIKAKNVKFDDVRAELKEALIREKIRSRLTHWFIELHDRAKIRKNLKTGLAH